MIVPDSSVWLHGERCRQGGSDSVRVHRRVALQRRVLQEWQQLNRSVSFSGLQRPDRFWLLFLFNQHFLCVLVPTEPGGQWSWSSGLLQFLPLRVVHNAVTMETLLHGEHFPTANLCANPGPQLLVERANVALKVEYGGKRPATTLVGTQEDHTRVSMNTLVLLKEPGVAEHFAALITFEDWPARRKIGC